MKDHAWHETTHADFLEAPQISTAPEEIEACPNHHNLRSASPQRD
jgi:hypothetical protein